MNNTLKLELEKYIAELEMTVEKMNAYGSLFSDSSIVYEEVCNHLKDMISAK